MIIIYGESGSGKTNKALSMIDENKKVLYFSLDLDKKNNKFLFNRKNLYYKYIRNCSIIDIDLDIFSRKNARMDISTLIIDPINLIKRDSKIKKIEDYYQIIENLKKIERLHNIEVIATFNILHIYNMVKNMLKEIDGIKLIELNSKLTIYR